MDKKELNDKLKELKKQIKANSKDAHFAGRLIDDLLSVKGQLMIEPLELDCGRKIDEVLGDKYRITLTDRGVLYHEYSGYSIFTPPVVDPETGRKAVLYESLAELVVNKEAYKNAEGEERENNDLIISVLGHILQVPKIALGDAEMSLEIATRVARYINETTEALMNKIEDEGLQEETIEKDRQFKEATLAMETLKEEAKKE